MEHMIDELFGNVERYYSDEELDVHIAFPTNLLYRVAVVNGHIRTFYKTFPDSPFPYNGVGIDEETDEINMKISGYLDEFASFCNSIETKSKLN